MGGESLTISEARDIFLKLPERLSGKGNGVIPITRRGENVMAVADWSFFDAMAETLEILSNPSLIEAIEEVRGRANKKDWKTTAEIREKLGL